VPEQLTDTELMDLFSRDKKAIDGLTFVLDGPNGLETVVGVDPEVLSASFAAVR
jgi:5-deoxy-5-amino-3-dehydroquinate synthase